jgi:hypothetical protein
VRYFRIYYKVAGGHTHTRWFSGGNPKAVFGKCGDLTFVNDEWEEIRRVLECGAAEHDNVQIKEESHHVGK